MALVSVPSKKAVRYDVDAGDTFVALALKYYGLASVAAPLALANKEALGKESLTLGDTLNFPPRLLGQTSRQSAQSNLQVGWLLHVTAEIAAACFAPGEEVWEDGNKAKASPGDDCDIVYYVHDPCAKLTSARLEVARKKEPGKVLAVIELEPEQFTSGKHALKWDGKCTEGSLKDKYIHPVHSPYLVRVVARTKERRVASNLPAEAVIRVKELRIERPPDFLSEPAPEPGTDAYYQEKLIELGYHCGPITNDASNADTKRALKLFQFKHRGLQLSGRLDQYTKAYLDGKSPSASGTARYQFILNAIGYGCGKIDGLRGKKTKYALKRFCEDAKLKVSEKLGATSKAALDAETLPPLERLEVLEGDMSVDRVYENALPNVGETKKIFIECTSVMSDISLPYNKKFADENNGLLRTRIPVVVKPLLESTAGKRVFSADATGPLPLEFNVDLAAVVDPAPVHPDFAKGYVEGALVQGGTSTGHHAHSSIGGVRTDAGPGVFKELPPYKIRSADEYCECVVEDTAYKGTAGVYFCSSTIGGDHFSLTVKVLESKMDAPLSKPVTLQTGGMRVWRRYQICKRWIMGYVPRPQAIEGPQLGIAKWYEAAYVELVEPVQPMRLMATPRASDREIINLPLYQALLELAGYSQEVVSHAQSKHSYSIPSLFPLKVSAVYNAKHEWDYYNAIENEVYAFDERFARAVRSVSFSESQPGLTVLALVNNAPTPPAKGVDPMSGIHHFSSISNPSWVMSVMSISRYVSFNQGICSLLKQAPGATMAHEVGHTLGLHHATTSKGYAPRADDQVEHDPFEYESCTMSYMNMGHFCGKCVLKLRGLNEAMV